MQLFENNGLQVVGTDKTGERVQVEAEEPNLFEQISTFPKFMNVDVIVCPIF